MTTGIRLAALVAIVGCAHHGGSGGDDYTDATLTLDPPVVALEITNGAAAHAVFTATLTLKNGTKRDVTGDTMFSVDTSYGLFVANDLTMGIGGHVMVFGTYVPANTTVDVSGSADVTARVKTVRIDPSLPPTTPGLFDPPDNAAYAPQIVYPAAGVVVPRNLGDFEVHWTDAHGSNVFEVALHTDYSDTKIYVKGGNGLAAAGPNASWASFQSQEWFTSVGAADSVKFTVRGANSATGNVGGAPAQTLALSHEEMRGGLYYWAAASSAPDAVTGIYRHDMERPGEPAEEFLTTKQTNNRCVACHVLSRDGTRMAVTYDGGGNPATMVDVAARKAAPTVTSWDFGTFTPDNAQFLSVEGSVLTVRDPSTLALIATMASDVPVTQPDLSADGAHLVYATNPQNNHEWDFPNGSIITRTYDQATHAFGPPVTLVADGKSNFYPSWSPDGAWILFNKADTNASSYDDANATTWVIKADGTQPAVQLAAADSALGITNSWPRWAPFGQTLAGTNELMFWITMASKRDFGVRVRNTGLFQRPAMGTPAKSSQIWMTPFFPNRAERKLDPSAPVFRLPFQNLTSSNHIAQWTEKVVVIQ
jgi:hypothetical protein